MGIIDIILGSIIHTLEIFDKYSSSIAAFSAIGALYYAKRAIKRTTEDNRKQILVGKIEEIFEIVVLLSVEYGHLYDAYILFEKSQSSEISLETRNAIGANFRSAMLKSNSEADSDELYKMTIRLNILANAYLTGDIKFQTIGYSQLFEALINVLKYRDLKTKEDEFPETLPTTENVFKLVNEMTRELVKAINLSSDNIGYKNYRETIFKQKLGLRE